MSNRDYYELLGVQKNADAAEIKSAFRTLARKYHPDVSEEADAEDRFKEIGEAYAVLSDDQKRAAYDRFGHAGVNGMGGSGGMPTDFDFSDIFEEIFGFGMGGGRSRGGGRTRRRKGSNLQQIINLTFEEAAFGVKKEINFNRDETCSHCKGERAEPGSSTSTCGTCRGQGQVLQERQSLFGQRMRVATTCPTCSGEGKTIDKPCTQCRGQGIERKRATKAIDVPAGVDHGTQIRLSEEGQPGSNGGPAGDLFVVIQVKNHKFFRRKEFDVILDLDINIAQATLGAEVNVPTLDGDAKLKIPAGIQAGKVLRMRNKGVPILQRDGRGDQMVIVNIVTPTKLTDEQRGLMEQLAESLGTEVFPAQDTFLDRIKDILGG